HRRPPCRTGIEPFNPSILVPRRPIFVYPISTHRLTNSRVPFVPVPISGARELIGKAEETGTGSEVLRDACPISSPSQSLQRLRLDGRGLRPRVMQVVSEPGLLIIELEPMPDIKLG